MEFLTWLATYIVPFLIILTVVVFVHEYGHYWVARRNGVRVDVFSVGFGPELFGATDQNGTRWKFSAIPLGGYVKMHGDADEASATIDQEAAFDPDSFPAKSVWQRMAIVVAGPVANFLFAIVALAILFAVEGRPFSAPVVESVSDDGAAAAAGLVSGDRFVEIEGQPIESFADIQAIVSVNAGNPLDVVIDRGGETLAFTLTPQMSELEDRFGNTHQLGLIGVTNSEIEFQRSNPATALFEATAETASLTVATLTGLWEMIIGARPADQLGGPIRIAQMSGEVAQDGLVPAFWFVAILSLNLGLINLFPIPMLDGGHLVMYGIEAARGRPLGERSQEYAFRFGLAVVLSLMLFATWNDLANLEIFEFLSGLAS